MIEPIIGPFFGKKDTSIIKHPNQSQPIALRNPLATSVAISMSSQILQSPQSQSATTVLPSPQVSPFYPTTPETLLPPSSPEPPPSPAAPSRLDGIAGLSTPLQADHVFDAHLAPVKPVAVRPGRTGGRGGTGVERRWSAVWSATRTKRWGRWGLKHTNIQSRVYNA